MRGADPGDTWTFCFVDEAMIRETPDGWETYDPFVEAGILVAKQHLEAGRTPDPAPGYVTAHGFPLGEWFAYVREARDAATWTRATRRSSKHCRAGTGRPARPGLPPC